MKISKYSCWPRLFQTTVCSYAACTPYVVHAVRSTAITATAELLVLYWQIQWCETETTRNNHFIVYTVTYNNNSSHIEFSCFTSVSIGAVRTQMGLGVQSPTGDKVSEIITQCFTKLVGKQPKIFTNLKPAINVKKSAWDLSAKLIALPRRTDEGIQGIRTGKEKTEWGRVEDNLNFEILRALLISKRCTQSSWNVKTWAK